MFLRVLHALVALIFVSTATSQLSQSARFIAENGQKVHGPDCDCYVVSGSDPGYFQHYRFWDFRHVPLNAAAASSYEFLPRVKVDTGAYGANARPVLLKDTPFANEWNIQDWHRDGSRLFPITIVNSDKNVFITKNPSDGGSTFLALRNRRFERYSSTAEIESTLRNFMHVSLRVRLRLLAKDESILSPPIEEEAVSKNQRVDAFPDALTLLPRNARRRPPPNGACAGIFTYFSTTSESDIEILTADPPNRVHYANQPDYDPVKNQIIPGAQITKDVPVPWTSWSTHRLDWFSGISRWYVENQHQTSLTYSVPTDPSMLIVNLWSDGGLWSGNLTVGESVYLGIEWIEVAYNLTSDAQRIKMRNKITDEEDEIHILTHPPSGVHHHPHGQESLSSPNIEKRQERRAPEEQLTKRGRTCKVKCRIDDIRFAGIPEVV